MRRLASQGVGASVRAHTRSGAGRGRQTTGTRFVREPVCSVCGRRGGRADDLTAGLRLSEVPAVSHGR